MIRFILFIIAILLAAPMSVLYSEETTPIEFAQTPKKILAKVPTTNRGKRTPSRYPFLECLVGNGEITFLPSFWGAGMTVTITDENDLEISAFVTIDEPTMSFDGQPGTFTVECNTLDGIYFIGTLEL